MRMEITSTCSLTFETSSVLLSAVDAALYGAQASSKLTVIPM